MPPSALAVLAVIAALEKRTGLKSVREDVFRAIRTMIDATDDEGVRVRLAPTIDLLCGSDTLRW